MFAVPAAQRQPAERSGGPTSVEDIKTRGMREALQRYGIGRVYSFIAYATNGSATLSREDIAQFPWERAEYHNHDYTERLLQQHAFFSGPTGFGVTLTAPLVGADGYRADVLIRGLYRDDLRPYAGRLPTGLRDHFAQFLKPVAPPRWWRGRR